MDSGKRRGSGPARGFIEISDAYSSILLATRCIAKTGVDFVFDPITRRMVIGNNFRGHEGIADAMGLNNIERERIVAGILFRDLAGRLSTNEASGHFYSQWNEASRALFLAFKASKSLGTIHLRGCARPAGGKFK